MINCDNATKENMNKHNLNWPNVPDHPYRKEWESGETGSGKKRLSLIW